MVKGFRLIIIILILCVFANTSFATKYYNKQLCSNSEYTCIKVKPGYTWDKLFPDPRKQDIIKRINRMNVELTPGRILALPNNLEQLDPLVFAPFPVRITPFDRTVIFIDLEKEAFAAYDIFGSLVYWGPISGGRDWCPDVNRSCRTPAGTYYIQSKGGYGCSSSKYPIPNGGAPMPYCMYFHGGYALHASTEVPGYNASHGCVRIFLKDAEWLNKNFIDVDKKKTKVIVQ